MKTFTVEVARDATVRFQAKVQAESLEEIKAHMHKDGYAGPIIGEWEQVSVSTYDNVEQYVVMDENETTLYEEDR